MFVPPVLAYISQRQSYSMEPSPISDGAKIPITVTEDHQITTQRTAKQRTNCITNENPTYQSLTVPLNSYEKFTI